MEEEKLYQFDNICNEFGGSEDGGGRLTNHHHHMVNTCDLQPAQPSPLLSPHHQYHYQQMQSSLLPKPPSPNTLQQSPSAPAPFSPPTNYQQPYTPAQPYNNNNNNNNNYQNVNPDMFNSIIMNPLKTKFTFRVSNFIIPPSQAIKGFEEYKKNLWFAPTGFKKQLSTDTLERIYIPFYSFNATYSVFFDGNVHHCPNSTNSGSHGQIKQRSTDPVALESTHHDSHSPNGVELDVGVKTKESGFITRSINKIFICALPVESSSKVNYHTNEEEDKIMYNFHKSVEMNNRQTFEQQCETQVVRICEHEPAEQVWRPHRDKIEVVEQTNAPAYLANQEQTDIVENVSSRVQFLEVTYMLYYVPYYHSRFEFNGHVYTYLVNGQNGQVISSRPQYGLGRFGDVVKGVKNYMTTLWGDAEKDIKRITGHDLSIDDQAKVYNPEHTYICWPRSATRLLSGYTPGWVEIYAPVGVVTVRAQKRRGSERGNEIIIGPGEKKIFSYTGHWCLEIMDDNLMVEIMGFSTTGGEHYPNISHRAT